MFVQRLSVQENESCDFENMSSLRSRVVAAVSWNISWDASFGILRIAARNIRIKVTETSPSTLHQALCFRVVSMQCVTCSVLDRLSLQRDSV